METLIINPIKKRCTQCGKEFVTDFDWKVTCSECLNKKWLSPKENSETIAKTDNHPCHHYTKIDTDNMDALCYSIKDMEIVKDTYDYLIKEKKIIENNKSKMKEYPFYGMVGIGIKKVIFSKPVTTIIWSNNTKTQIRCQKGDKWDPEKALAMAICKKALGNTPYFNNYFKKWLSEAKVEDPKKKKAEKKRKKEAAKKANKANT